MNFSFLPFGVRGIVAEALISLMAGVVLGLAHAWGSRHGWTRFA
jgi:hypothetical protein